MSIYFSKPINKMIKEILISFALLLPIAVISQNDISVGVAYDWNQLGQSDQELIRVSAEKYLAKLADKDVEGFWEMCHSKFKQSTPFVAFKEVGKIIADMIPTMDSLVFLDAKKVVYVSAPQTSQFTTGGSLDKSNPTYLQFYTFPGIENQCIALYKLETKPLAKIISMKFGLEGSVYKLINFDINTASVNGKNATHYVQVADNWKEKGDDFSEFIALKMAYRLSYLGKGTTTSTMIEVSDRLQKCQKDSALIAKIVKWTVNDSLFDVINVDFIETQSDLTPNFIYVSKVQLGEIKTKEEVKILFKYLKKNYPELVSEFKMFIFTAYEEYPVIATKQYKYFRVFMDIEDEK